MSGRAKKESLRALARPLTLLLLFVCCVAQIARGQQVRQLPRPTPAIRVTSSNVDVNVIVTDSHGRFAGGLGRKDFRVFDDGIERPIMSYASNQDPSHVVLMIESGTADFLFGKLGRSPFIRADGLLDQMSPTDQLSIVTYSDRAYVDLDFTPDKLAAHYGLQRLNMLLIHGAVGSNSMELSSSLAAVLYWLRKFPGKKAIVLLSTGIDSSRPEYRQFVEDELKSSDVPILAVSMFGDFRKLPGHRVLNTDEREERAYVKQGMSDADRWLELLVRATGGRIYLPKSVKEFDEAYAQIAQLVRGEYNLGFVPSVVDGKVHAITVKVNHPWYRSYHVEYRQAYTAGATFPD